MATLSERRPEIAAAVIVAHGRLLLVHRRVAEGRLSWQFPAGEVEADETSEQAAVRETWEEVGLTVKAVKSLGRRVHPLTGRTMSYTACEVVTGSASVVDAEELDHIAWCNAAKVKHLVPYPFYEPVQRHIDLAVTA